MTVGTEADLQGMQRAGRVVAEALLTLNCTLKAAIRPGATLAELDALAGTVFLPIPTA